MTGSCQTPEKQSHLLFLPRQSWSLLTHTYTHSASERERERVLYLDVSFRLQTFELMLDLSVIRLSWRDVDGNFDASEKIQFTLQSQVQTINLHTHKHAYIRLWLKHFARDNDLFMGGVRFRFMLPRTHTHIFFGCLMANIALSLFVYLLFDPYVIAYTVARNPFANGTDLAFVHCHLFSIIRY